MKVLLTYLCFWNSNVNKKYLLNIFSWMPFLNVKFIRVEIEYMHFPSLTCSSLIAMSLSWATGPSQKHIYPWITLHPQTLHPIDIPLVHSVISVLTVYILSLPPVFLSPSAQSVWAVKRINLYIPLPLLKNTVLFPGVKSQIFAAAAAAAKLLPSCPTLCDPIDGSPPGSPVPGILQARTLEWVAISFSNAWKWKVKGKSLSCVRLLATPWTTAYQAPPSMGFSRQEYWSGVPLPSPLKSLVGFKKFFIKCGPFIPLQHPLVFTPASWLSQTASSLTSIPFHMLFSPQKASFPPSLLTPSTISSQLALDYTLLWHSA